MRTLDDNLMLCIDCTLLAETGELPEDPKIERACLAGLEALTKGGEQALAQWSTDDDDGVREFSRQPCECCGSHLGGTRQRYTLLTSAPMPAAEAAELQDDVNTLRAERDAAETKLVDAEETIADLRETVAELRALAAAHEHPDIRARWILERADDFMSLEQPHANH